MISCYEYHFSVALMRNTGWRTHDIHSYTTKNAVLAATRLKQLNTQNYIINYGKPFLTV